MPVTTYMQAILILSVLVVCMVLLAMLLKKTRASLQRFPENEGLHIQNQLALDTKHHATLLNVCGAKALYISSPHGGTITWVPQHDASNQAFNQSEDGPLLKKHASRIISESHFEPSLNSDTALPQDISAKSMSIHTKDFPDQEPIALTSLSTHTHVGKQA